MNGTSFALALIFIIVVMLLVFYLHLGGFDD